MRAKCIKHSGYQQCLVVYKLKHVRPNSVAVVDLLPLCKAGIISDSPNLCTRTMDTIQCILKPLPTTLYSSCLGFGCRNPWLLLSLMVFGIYFEKMVYDDEQHGSTSEEDCERVELGVCNHLDGVGAWNVAG